MGTSGLTQCSQLFVTINGQSRADKNSMAVHIDYGMVWYEVEWSLCILICTNICLH